jgi:hypothetical protein
MTKHFTAGTSFFYVLTLLSSLHTLSWLPPAPVPTAAPSTNQKILLEAHEANRAGFTKDSDDQLFMDFLVSIQHPIGLESAENNHRSYLPYFSFTGRFGQYLFERDSSPVVAKRFNPKLFFRYFMNNETVFNRNNPSSFIDFEYAHESNGQSINSQLSFDAVAMSPGNKPAYAKDNLSRGWDYLGVAGQKKLNDLTIAYGFRYFLDYGILQRGIEQFQVWESPRSITQISQVSGIRLNVDWRIDGNIVDDFSIRVETGYRDILKYTTAELDVAIKPFYHGLGIPVVLWIRTGYNSDLAQFYEKVTSYGFALKFVSFK